MCYHIPKLRNKTSREVNSIKMFKSLTNMLTNSVKCLPILTHNESSTIKIISAVFEYMPLQLLAKHSDHETLEQPNQLCLLLCTDVALELWVFRNYKKFDRLFHKAETNIHLARYLPIDRTFMRSIKLSPLSKCLKTSAPIIAVLKPLDEFSKSFGISLFSLKTLQYFHALRFPEPLFNFIVSPYHVVGLLNNGDIQVYSLDTLELISIIPTINNTTTNEHILQELTPVCDIATNIIAYAKYDINTEDDYSIMANEVMKNRIIENNTFVKNATRKIVEWGEYGYKEVRNLYNARKAIKLERDVSLAKNNEEVKRHKSSFEDIKEEEDFVEITEEMVEEIESKIRNRCYIEVLRLSDELVLTTITPPYFFGISQIKFSPSSNFLLTVNESGQHFYVYKLFPETNERHQEMQKGAVLMYSIFRGYTSAKVSCISFSLCETWLIVNSNKGTSHIYRLEQNRREHSFNDNCMEIINLTAFGRFKYQRKRSNVKDVKPITSIVSHYPVNMLGTKKEVLKRMGVSFFNTFTNNNTDDCYKDIPLFVTVTSEGELYTNALMIFKTQSMNTGIYNFNLVAGLKDKLFAELTGTHNTTILLVETIANCTLSLETHGRLYEKILDKNVIPRVSEELNYKEVEDDIAEPIQSKDNNEMQKWLKKIVITSCNEMPKEEVVIKHCTWRSKPKETTAVNDELYEEMLSHERPYVPIGEVKKGYSLDSSECMLKNNDLKDLEREGRLVPIEINPFEDEEFDKELESKIKQTQNSLIHIINHN